MENYQSARELILQMLKTRMAFRQALQHLLRDNNVEMTFEMLQIMTCLWHEQGVSQQMLAEKTSKDKACLTNLMSNLERRGWVTRQVDPADGRNRLVYLTPQGQVANDHIRPLIKELYCQVGQQMGLNQVHECINQLKKLDEILGQL
ncbi:MAG: MarR family transcriptional regulator [Mucinivorans sp.]